MLTIKSIITYCLKNPKNKNIGKKKYFISNQSKSNLFWAYVKNFLKKTLKLCFLNSELKITNLEMIIQYKALNKPALNPIISIFKSLDCIYKYKDIIIGKKIS